MKTSNNFKFLALFLISSIILVTAASTTTSVNAQSQASVYVYNSQGGNVSANGTQLTPATTSDYADGDTVVYTATPGAGFAFLCWNWISSSAPTTSIESTLTETLSASDACAIQALFVPITNATQMPSGSGSATVVMLLPAGGTTSPESGTATESSSSYTNYTIGEASTFTATPSTDFKFLYWLVVSSEGSSYFTDSTISLYVPASEVAMQAFFVPSSSTVVIDEYSNVAIAILAVVLAISAFGVFAFKRRAK